MGNNDLILRAEALEVIDAVKGIVWSQSGKVLCGKIYSQIKDIPAVNEEREPRVMTLEEVNRFVYGTPYIIEINKPREEPRLIYGLYSHQGVNGCFYFAFTDARSHFFDVDYGKRWRCWTSRPTDAQREAKPWEG